MLSQIHSHPYSPESIFLSEPLCLAHHIRQNCFFPPTWGTSPSLNPALTSLAFPCPVAEAVSHRLYFPRLEMFPEFHYPPVNICPKVRGLARQPLLPAPFPQNSSGLSSTKTGIQSLVSVHQTTPLHWGEAESLPATSAMSVESSLVLSVYYLYCFPKFPFCTSEIPHSFLRTVHFLLGFLHCFIAIPPHFTQNSLQLPGNLWVIFSELTFCFLGVLPQLSKNSIFLSNDFSLFFHEFSVVF